MKSFVISVILFLLTLKGLFAYDTLSVQFLPLNVGNFWVYNTNTGIKRYTVTSSRNVNNHKYYWINVSNYSYIHGYIRVDSLTGSLYRYDSTGYCPRYHNEILIDSFAAVVGDTIWPCDRGIFRCVMREAYSVFGLSTIKIGCLSHEYGSNWANHNEKYYIAKIGIAELSGWVVAPGVNASGYEILKGAKINGITYGDTSMVYVKNISSEIPNNYELGQNYPNPFNQYSIIDFKFQMKSNIVLKVYDAGGREVQTLVNETLAPGTYQVRFDGSGLASGLYYYSLSVDGKQTAVKKMVMVK